MAADFAKVVINFASHWENTRLGKRATARCSVYNKTCKMQRMYYMGKVVYINIVHDTNLVLIEYRTLTAVYNCLNQNNTNAGAVVSTVQLC